MFKLPGNFGDMLKQMQGMQENVAEIKDSLEQKRIVGDAGAGMVRVTVSGTCEVLSVEIDPKMLEAPDKLMIEELVRSATNDGLAKAKTLIKDEIAKLGGGLAIPGFS